MKQSIAERIEFLRREIDRHDRLYYVEARPVIGDRDYDLLYGELAELEKLHPEFHDPASPTQRVSGEPVAAFAQVVHDPPMQSLDKTHTKAELADFAAMVGRELPGEHPSFCVEPKVDGVSISLRYEKRRLVCAATRGNGSVGDDVTGNVRTVKSVPLVLDGSAPETLEVRGEIYMPSADFDTLNAERDADGLPAFANPRNATAGTIKLLDAAEVARRPLRFLAHGLGVYEGPALRCTQDFTDLLDRMGIPRNQPVIYADTLEATRAAVQQVNELRRNLGYGTDGAVIKLDDFGLRGSLGSTARAPRWAAAFKYLPEQKETVLRAISIQVGRTGVLTPVAELEPVQLSGTTVSRATLHNQDEIARKDIRIGDTVLMEKSGEIIPAVVHVITARRPADAVPYSLYDAVGGVCPSCCAPIAQEEGQVAWRCTNFTCPAQAAMRTTYFCRREALDIENLGGTVAEALVNRGMISTPLDLFTLTVEQLGALNLGTDDEPRRFGEKNAAKALAGLQNARTLPLERWLTAFGISTIGTVTARTTARYHRDLAELARGEFLRLLVQLEEGVEQHNALNPKARANKGADKDELLARQAALKAELEAHAAPYAARGYVALEADGANKLKFTNPLGSVSTRKLLAYFQSTAGKAVLSTLTDLGINPAAAGFVENMNNQAEGPLSGKTFVLTGALSRPRPEFEKMIAAAGGKATGTVTRNTTYLVAGEGGGSKRDKAAKLGIPIISEEEIEQMMQSEGSDNQSEEELFTLES